MSVPLDAPPTIPPLDSTLGAIEIGGVVSTFLFGIETLQAYHYFREYPEDSQLLRGTVATIWLFELGHTIAAWHAIYSVTVTFYAQLQYLETPPHSLEMTILFALMINGAIQIFFANRIGFLSKKWIIPIICWTLASLRIIGNLAMMGIQWKNPEVSTLQTKWKWLMATTLSVGLAVDIIVTASLCYWLGKIRKSKFRKTRRMVDALLLWSLESGVVISATSGMLFILFLARTDLAWFPFYLVQAKLYANSLLVSLNGRQRFRSPNPDAIQTVGLSTSGSGTLGLATVEKNKVGAFEMASKSGTDIVFSNSKVTFFEIPGYNF
ncbi:hypothetical protein K438DRAFT_1969493 [Mycena galopus ATCC 62051]|nr:hypothetical protein K438DRAFT_1969493 [Mycena galopus ATCC 62051]